MFCSTQKKSPSWELTWQTRARNQKLPRNKPTKEKSKYCGTFKNQWCTGQSAAKSLSAICIAGSHACWLWNTLTAEQLQKNLDKWEWSYFNLEEYHRKTQMNTNTVHIKKTPKTSNMNLSCILSLYIGFSLLCFIKIGHDISASIACLSHLFIEHSILEISSIKVLVKIHPAYRTG